MAFNATLYNSSFLLDLSASPYKVRYGAAWGVPEAERVHSRPWARGFAPLVGVNYGNRQASFVITITGTSLDNWIVNSRQIRQLLKDTELYWQTGGVQGDRAYLSIQLDGATNAIETDIITGILGDDAFGNPTMQSTTAPALREVPLELTIKPFSRPQLLSQSVSGTLANGTDTFTVAAPAGDRETPIKLTVQNSSNVERVIVARRTRGNTSNYRFVLEAEPGTYPGYSVESITTAAGRLTIVTATNSSAHNASGLASITQASAAVGSLTTAPLLRWRLDDNLADMMGRHRVFLKFVAGPGAIPWNTTEMTAIGLTYGGLISSAAGQGEIRNNMVTPGQDHQLVDLGVIEIPHRQIGAAPIGFFDMAVHANLTSVTGRWGLDCLYLFPVDEQYMDLTLNEAATGAAQIVNDNLSPVPSLYSLTSAGVFTFRVPTAQTFDSRFTMMPGVPNRFLALTFETSNTISLVDTYTMTVDYAPMYDVWR